MKVLKKYKYIILALTFIFMMISYYVLVQDVEIVDVHGDLIIYQKGKAKKSIGVMDTDGNVIIRNQFIDYDFAGDLLLLKKKTISGDIDLHIVKQSDPKEVVKVYRNVDEFVDIYNGIYREIRNSHFNDYQIFYLKDLDKDVLIRFDGKILELVRSFTDYGHNGMHDKLFNNGYAIIKVDDKLGAIDEEGNIVVEPIYYYLGEFNEAGLSIACNGPMDCGVINTEGGVVENIVYLEDRAEEKLNHQTTLLLHKNVYENDIVEDNGKYGVVAVGGNESVIPSIYDEIRILGREYYLVKKDNLYGVYDYKGTEIISVTHDSIILDEYAGFNHDDVLIASKNNKYGIYDLDGNILIDFKYDFISMGSSITERYFSKAIYIVTMDDKKGFVDLSGKEITEIDYKSVETYNNILLVNKDGKYQIVDYENRLKLRWWYQYFNVSNKHFITMQDEVIYSEDGNLYKDGQLIHHQYFNLNMDNFIKLFLSVPIGFVLAVITIYPIEKIIKRRKELKELRSRLDI